MSEYFLADKKAAERARLRKQEQELKKQQPGAQDMKVTLLGDFLFPTSESQGCDPYNSSHGRAVKDAWRSRRERR